MKDLQYDHINMLLYVSFFHSFQLIILIVSVICCRSTKGTLMRSLPRGQTRWLSTEFNTGDDQVSKLEHLSQILLDSIQNVRTSILQFPSCNMFTLNLSQNLVVRAYAAMLYSVTIIQSYVHTAYTNAQHIIIDQF